MNLIPIVYTSLVLFFGFLLIIVTISYLTFKTRSKVNPLIEEEIKKQQKKLVVIRQNQYIAHQSNMQKQNNIVAQPSYAYQNNAIINNEVKILPSNYFQNVNDDKNNVQRFNRDQNDAMQSRSSKSRETTVISARDKHAGNRIKIMNGSFKFFNDSKIMLNDIETKNFLPSQAEYNMFNFYSDIPETGLSSITAAPNRAV